VQPEPELDPISDPLEPCSSSFPGPDWENQIRSIEVRKPQIPSAEEQKSRIRWILDTLDSESNEPESWQVEQAHQWLKELASLIPDRNQFVASNFSYFHPAWKELLRGTKRKSAKAILSWLKAGLRPRFCGTSQAKPSKRTIVEAMLKGIAQPSEIPHLLSGRYPHRVAFQNHQSLFQHWEFTQDQVFKLIEWGAAGIWIGPEPPEVINPMGVVQSAGKFRLICNMKYSNLFLEALPFRYEWLRDILEFTTKGSFMATWDLKSGHFHVPIHKDAWKYCGFRIENLTFYFKVLPFGFAQACYVFTKIMQEPAFELRKRGVQVSSYIDDGFTAARSSGKCLRQSMLCSLLLGVLGAFLGIPKCQLTPQLLAKWLGFLVDSRDEMFRVSESKLAKVKEVLEEMIGSPSTSRRKLAALAGKLVALGPAVLPAALYSRKLFMAMQGQLNWDQVFPTLESVKKCVQF
jgi:hypothetical protein